MVISPKPNVYNKIFFKTLPKSFAVTTAAVKVCVIKTSNASIINHKPGDIAAPGQSQDIAELRGVVTSDREEEPEPEKNLFSKLSTQCLELEAGRILEVVAVNLSRQEDAELHHLLKHGGCERLHGNVVVQLRRGDRDTVVM